MPPETTPQNSNNPTDMIEGSEHVLVVVRKHWAGIVGIYAIATLLAVALIGLAVVVLPQMNLSYQSNVLLALSAVVVVGAFMLILATMIYVYHQSKLTLTDQSLVQVIQRSLFNCKTSRLSMSNVEDVNVEQTGVIANIFGYGTLTVQTAGEEDNFVFTYCPTPNIYAERILEARQSYARQHPGI